MSITKFIGHSPEYNAGMIIVVRYHFPHLPFQIIKISGSGINAAFIYPGNFRLDNNTKLIAFIECTGIVRIVCNTEEIASKFLNDFKVRVYIFLGNSAGLTRFVLMIGNAA